MIFTKSISGMLLVVTWSLAGSAAYGQSPNVGGPTPSPEGAAVYFIDLQDGARMPQQFTVHFGLRNMGVAPAGTDRPNTGHHHLLVDADPIALNEPIPNDFNHVHFGAGQTEAEIVLAPGQHTLQLVLGDRNHVPHSPPVMSERITITVVAGAAGPDVTASPETANSPENGMSPETAMVPPSGRPEPTNEDETPRAHRTHERHHADQPHRRIRSARRGNDDAPARVRSGPAPKYQGPCRIDLGYGRYEACR